MDPHFLCRGFRRHHNPGRDNLPHDRLRGQVFTVFSGRLTVLVNMATATEATETRSYWRKLRDEILAAYSVFQADPTQAYSIAGERSVTLKSTADFQRALGEAQAHVRAEENAAAGGGNNNVLMRFRNSR